jgi:hypothetical protein
MEDFVIARFLPSWEKADLEDETRMKGRGG